MYHLALLLWLFHNFFANTSANIVKGERKVLNLFKNFSEPHPILATANIVKGERKSSNSFKNFSEPHPILATANIVIIISLTNYFGKISLIIFIYAISLLFNMFYNTIVIPHFAKSSWQIDPERATFHSIYYTTTYSSKYLGRDGDKGVIAKWQDKNEV